jgi:hypothetical protein
MDGCEGILPKGRRSLSILLRNGLGRFSSSVQSYTGAGFSATRATVVVTFVIMDGCGCMREEDF